MQVRTEVYIPHKYQVKLYLSPCFLAACTAAISDRIHFSYFYHQNKSFASKVKFSQTSNHCKRFLKTAILPFASWTKESIISQKLGSHDLANSSISVKVEFAILFLFNSSEVLLSAFNKLKLFTLILMTEVFLYLLLLPELI